MIATLVLGHADATAGIEVVHARLPVWPAWQGLVLGVLGQLLAAARCDKLEDAFGGRVAR